MSDLFMVKKTRHLSKQHHSIKKTWILYWRFVYKSRLKWVRNLTLWNGPRMYRSADQDWCVTSREGAELQWDIRTLPTRTLVAPNSIPLNPESCCSPKLKLLFSYCERFFHLDLATVMDHDVLERFISPIFLCVLNLSHHILEDSKQLALE